LTIRLEYEKRKDLATPLKNVQKKRKEDQAKLKELNKSIKESDAQNEKLQSEMKALNDQREVPACLLLVLRCVVLCCCAVLRCVWNHRELTNIHQTIGIKEGCRRFGNRN